MLDFLMEALVGLGELVLIMLASALLMGFVHLLKETFFKKSCDKK